MIADQFLQDELGVDRIARLLKSGGERQQRTWNLVALRILQQYLVQLDDRAIVVALAEVRLADPELRVVGQVGFRIVAQILTELLDGLISLTAAIALQRTTVRFVGGI